MLGLRPTGEIIMLKFASALALLLIGTAPLLADDMPINADAIKWGPAPAVLPTGADMAVIAGDRRRMASTCCG